MRPLLPFGATPIFAVALLSFATYAEETPADPALSLHAPALSAEDEKLVRGWFKELGSDEFDARNRALSNLVSKGPAVLPIAREFSNDPNPDVASISKSLRVKILVNYEGF